MPTADMEGASRAGVYGDFVAQVDATVGAVLDALDRHGLSGDTLVVLASDNGADERFILPSYHHEANDRFRGQKADIWDGGHRVPFIVRWPGRVPDHSVCGETVCLTDLLATCADLVGERLPDGAGEDSVSILPALLGEERSKPIRKATVLHSLSGMFSIRKGDWKLILGRGSGGFGWNADDHLPRPSESPGQLYNLAEDIGEERNLYTSRPDVVRWLTELLDTYRKQGYSRPM